LHHLPRAPLLLSLLLLLGTFLAFAPHPGTPKVASAEVRPATELAVVGEGVAMAGQEEAILVPLRASASSRASALARLRARLRALSETLGAAGIPAASLSPLPVRTLVLPQGVEAEGGLILDERALPALSMRALKQGAASASSLARTLSVLGARRIRLKTPSPDQLLRAGMRSALADARRKAKALAEALGTKLGPPLRIHFLGGQLTTSRNDTLTYSVRLSVTYQERP